MSRRYETVYIFDSTLDEPAITEKLNRFHALLIKDGKGTLSNVSHWGKRTMAYKVKKKETGYYVVAEFSTAGRLLLALTAFMLWAHPSLVGLPCAVLLILAPGGSEDGTHDRGSTWRQPIAAMIGAVSLALLVVSGGSGSRLAAAQSTYIVLATAAFVSFVLLEPAPILRQAFRAIVAAGLASAVLIQTIWGSEAWGALGWEATRHASITIRTIVEVAPDALPIYQPVVRFVSLTWPGMLALQTLAGVVLARR